ncbi:DUF1223 domain-containing protein [Flavobacterium sp. LC2016-01]|uniref:DUF1223 domain-containing protein n=1 Tax=Flavobacterium sp. LC2016-01 TaxID=2675876 RepID=UPI0012BAC973|nr:DUF1223 domain-containing protein [Flavobacterium sp. LC2016-01]MTH14788.1 DUF1223 domain-containing protein [Flavobacterium sp. LC2016-01]
MKNILLITGVIALSGLFFLNCFMFPDSEDEFTGAFKTEKTKLETTSSNSFAVVELFTSEGCSSCPPADALLVKLEEQAKDKNIYVLAYHVDYWDRLGWKDQFSSNEFTKRQQKYQDWLNLFVIYTPQFIMNGTLEFAGYNEMGLSEKVSDVLQTKQSGNLKLTANIAKSSLNIDFKTDDIQKDSSLFIAVIQKQGISKVERGENSGTTLHHVQIVRELKSFPINKTEGSITIEKPSNFNETEWEIIGFIQNTTTGKIVKATKTILQ